jgi:hypothetical protein
MKSDQGPAGPAECRSFWDTQSSSALNYGSGESLYDLPTGYTQIFDSHIGVASLRCIEINYLVQHCRTPLSVPSSFQESTCSKDTKPASVRSPFADLKKYDYLDLSEGSSEIREGSESGLSQKDF